jgi:hypothetical protein
MTLKLLKHRALITDEIAIIDVLGHRFGSPEKPSAWPILLLLHAYPAE